MNNDLIYVNVLSNNHQRLIDFYHNVVGLQPLNANANVLVDKWYGFDTGHTQFAIEPMSNRDKYGFEYNKGNPILVQFKANSLEHLTEWTERLEREGVHIGQRMMKKSYGTVTTFTDPDGNVMELLYREEM